jgi:hypothetical protein
MTSVDVRVSSVAAIQKLDERDTIRLYVPVMFWLEPGQMGRVRLEDMSVADLLDRYGAIVSEEAPKNVGRKRSRRYIARLSAVERELQARSDDEWLASLTKKERADPERAAQIVRLRRWTHGGSKKGGKPPLHVRDPRLRVVPTAELLERFAALAIKEDGAGIETRDRHYWKIEAIEDELRWREGDEGLRALLSLYTHPHIAVRARAADGTRQIEPELSRSRLEAIDDDGWTPEGGPTGVVPGGPVHAKARGRAARGKRVLLGKMTAAELVERYVAISLEQYKAIDWDEISRFNRVFVLRHAVEAELKRREGDQRRALLPLLEHRNLQVRLNAATDTLAVAPEAARRALETIRDTHWMPYAADAASRLRRLDEGRFKPR